MILTDTSVLIDYTRGTDAKLLAFLPTVPVVVCGVVRAEVIAGARNAAHRANLIAILAPFPVLPIPDPLWDTVGDDMNALRAGGVTVSFQDTVIATVAIANDIELWTRDGHFALVRRVLTQLKLFAEPP